MIQASSAGVGPVGVRSVVLRSVVMVRARSAPRTAATSASPKTSSARSSGSSASTGTYAAPAASTARIETYRSLVPEGTRTPTRSPGPIPAAVSRRRSCPTSAASAR